MKARYYVCRQVDGWAVMDCRVVPNARVAIFDARSAARGRARELNAKDRREETKEEARHAI